MGVSDGGALERQEAVSVVILGRAVVAHCQETTSSIHQHKLERDPFYYADLATADLANNQWPSNGVAVVRATCESGLHATSRAVDATI